VASGGTPASPQRQGAIVLGSAQDAGVPQAGCDCPTCAAALADPARRRLPACLGLWDESVGGHWLIDATPALAEQWARLRRAAPGTRLAGVLLTHLHMGHYTGLVQLGHEAAATRGVPVYATLSCVAHLRANQPWSDLETAGHVSYRALAPLDALRLAPDLDIVAVPVPHRADAVDTVAFLVRGPARCLFYCPDIDGWDRWDEDLATFLRREGVSVALLDGTFTSTDEPPARALESVPHPLVADTARRVGGLEADVRVIHLNHTNALLTGAPAPAGVRVTAEGDAWRIG
jgi:pyrroloquinoline quinone biosynthesis protein B